MSEAEQVLVTGAAGHLGSHLVSALLAEGFRVTGLDMAAPAAPLPSACRFVQADLCDAAAARRSIEGVDLVVHCASIHPWKRYTDAQYLDANVKGTWQLYSAAADLGVARVVLTSSIAAIGYHRIPPEACPIREDDRFPLGDLYSFTKHAQETVAGMFAHQGKVRTIALRPPPFMPREDLQVGFSLTGVYATVQDMTAAHVAAVRVLAGREEPGEPLAPFEAFFTTNRLPYTREDLMAARDQGTRRPLIEKYWPGAWEWLSARGYTGQATTYNAYDLSKAKRLLRWAPAYNFEQWFAEHADEP